MMALIEGQWQIRDLIVGPGTPWSVQSSTNPFTLSTRADQSGGRAWNHGAWSGAEWGEQRVVPMRLLGIAPSGDMSGSIHLIQQLNAAFRPVGEAATDVELRFTLGGSEFIMFGRPRMSEPETRDINHGAVLASTAFVALDPFIYSADEQSETLGLPLFTGGLTVPFTVPLTVPGTLSAGTAEVTNDGTAETSLQLRIDGPVLMPRVVLKRNDGVVQTLSFDLALEAGQWLDVDTGAHVVLLNGVSSRRAQTIGTFPTLPPGTSILRFFAAEHTDDATLTATWRSAWW